MTAKNHFLFSVSVASLTLGTLDPFVLLIAGAMSLLPDIDSSKSVYGKILFPLSRLIERHFPHRTFTHSFFFTAILAIGLIPLAFQSKEFYFAALIGFFCGWFLDVFTKAGVSAFYPMSMARLVIPANPALRLTTGSRNEWFFSVIFLALIVISFQLHSSGGVMQIFSSLLAQPTGVSEMFRTHGQTNKIYAFVEGQTATGNISGKFPVVDLLSNDVFIIRNSENILLTVGDAQCLQCHVRANSVKGVLGESIFIRIEEIKLDDKLIGKLVSLLENEPGEVLIYGELNLSEAEDLRVETSQLQFNPLQISTNLETKTVRFQSASLEDLRRLAKYNGDGRLVVKIIMNL